MKHWIIILMTFLILGSSVVPAVLAGESDKDKMKAQHKREKIDLVAKDTLERLCAENEGARQLLDKAYGYAVFDNLKLSFVIAGGGGSGVAVENESGKRTYMNMGTGGLSLGLGGQKYQVVFFFETQKVFDEFTDKGWSADASANAVALDSGANLQAKFVNGVAVYQMTEKGLMLQADISGTKYWKNDKLNTSMAEEKSDEETEDEENQKEKDES
jgi:lipid-binding SYLF domain-containing protein